MREGCFMAMKKILALLTILCLTASLFAFNINAEGLTKNVTDAEDRGTARFNQDGYAIIEDKAYLGFKSIDMTGIKSVTIEASCLLPYGSNGDAVKVKADDPEGEILGYVLVNHAEKSKFTANIKEISGVHDIYLTSTYAHDNYVKIKSITFNKESYTPEILPVPDENIIDNYSDTWEATDDLGRKVASFEEAGPVKEGEHVAGIMYWNWFERSDVNPHIPAEIIKKYPDSKDDYEHEAWDKNGVYYWAEPLLGYYSSYEYWVYRRHAQWLANAGIDAIFLDYTNNDMTFVGPQNVLLSAFHDAREDGIDAPKVSCYIFNARYAFDSLSAFYFNVIKNDSYSDLVFMWEGKPLVCSPGRDAVMHEAKKEKDPELIALLTEIFDNVNIRTNGSREFGISNEVPDPQWQWLENYPLHHWGRTDRADGRVESMTLGTAINHSYIYGYNEVGIMSNFDTKGRGYSEAFGEDYSPNSARSAIFMREQAAQILDIDPAFCYIDGWNEWTAIRNKIYGNYENAFVDTFDDENSRDMEPTNGALKDDYYNLLVDFVRKYKGVRPVPVAGSEKTIDITGDVSAWDSVTPEFINDKAQSARNGILVGGKEITTTLNNAISRAKVSRDSENLYFYVKTEEAIKTGTNEFIHLYINTDRNRATGWEGYDFAFNRADKKLEKWENGTWAAVSDISYTVKGNVLQAAIPRSLLGLTDKINMEFKWVDGAGEIASGNILDVYRDGSSAPMGRFNYVYTEIPETTLSAEERKALSDTVILAPGKTKMIVDGAKVFVYEPDIRIAPIERNGTLYVPMDTIAEMMYGESKLEYDSYRNLLYVKAFRLVDREITDYRWTYTALGSNEVRINGVEGTLTAPAIAEGGMVYVPVTYLSDCFDWTITVDSGLYLLGRGKTADVATAKSVAYHLG